MRIVDSGSKTLSSLVELVSYPSRSPFMNPLRPLHLATHQCPRCSGVQEFTGGMVDLRVGAVGMILNFKEDGTCTKPEAQH